jgi:hypothetical protein
MRIEKLTMAYILPSVLKARVNQFADKGDLKISNIEKSKELAFLIHEIIIQRRVYFCLSCIPRRN